jgi:catechol 2,3-dioxygenase-like lactoylglutathione lyase family enzyme
MRQFLVSSFLIFAALAPGQSVQPASPNAVKLTKYILGVADLDKSYAFYHALGLDLQSNAATLTAKPNLLNDALRSLVNVPPGTKFRNMMLKIPGAEFPLEVTEFTAMDVHPAKPRIQDPGASLLVLDVDDVDAALAAAKKAGGEVVTVGGSPVKRASGPGRVVTLRDPDGYYVELAQTTDKAAGSGKVIGATFGSMVVQSSEKAAAFYRDQFGLVVKTNAWTSNFAANLGTPGAQVQTAEVTVPGTALSWRFMEFKDADRKSYTPRIPDPGAPAIGLQVRDIDAAIAAVKAAGGASVTQGGSVKLGNGKVGFVRDPNGLLVELAQN